MSIDTASKRRRAASVLPIHKVPIPTGTIDWASRAGIAWIYPLYTPGIYINNIWAQIRKGSLLVDKRIEERSTADFTIVDIPGTATYQKGQAVEIYDDIGGLEFGGV
ncbi:unnamed protein product, partial [marine sediment metagenome]